MLYQGGKIMGYFKEENYKEKRVNNVSKSEELLNKLSKICLDELMFSSDAYICMIELNLHGYKRLHRYLSKEFYNLYLELQNKIVEKYDRALPMPKEFKKYTTDSLKEHLEHWTEILKEHLKEVGEIIKGVFEEDGYIPCVAQKVQKKLYKNIIKNERALQKFEDCDWSYEVIYQHDYYLHSKLKELEGGYN